MTIAHRSKSLAITTLITWHQRVALLAILERESDRLQHEAARLDEALMRAEAAYEVADDMPTTTGTARLSTGPCSTATRSRQPRTPW